MRRWLASTFTFDHHKRLSQKNKREERGIKESKGLKKKRGGGFTTAIKL